MEWYVLIENFNEKKIDYYNIFNNIKFSEGVKELLENFITFEDFVEKLEKKLMYAFWCKAEYEVIVSDLFETFNKKIDIYSQVKPNIKILAEYIIEKHNEQLCAEPSLMVG